MMLLNPSVVALMIYFIRLLQDDSFLIIRYCLSTYEAIVAQQDGSDREEPKTKTESSDENDEDACKIYISVAKHLLSGKTACEAVAAAIGEQGSVPYEFRRLYVLSELPVNEIYSTGYAVHTLEAALWCVIHGDSYKKTVMLAISLGEETGTIAALAGGLAGVCYGFACGRKRIPRSWIKKLRNRHIIEPLCDKMAEAITKKGTPG